MEGLENLGITFTGVLAQVVCFLLLLVMLRVFAYKPILKMLDDRSEKIQHSMEQAEATRRRSFEVERESKAQIETAHKEGQVIIAQAQQIAEQLKKDAPSQARKEAEELLAKARVEIEHERLESMEQLRQEFADIAVTAAEKIIGCTMDKTTHEKLIEELLEESVFPKHN